MSSELEVLLEVVAVLSEDELEDVVLLEDDVRDSLDDDDVDVDDVDDEDVDNDSLDDDDVDVLDVELDEVDKLWLLDEDEDEDEVTDVDVDSLDEVVKLPDVEELELLRKSPEVELLLEVELEEVLLLDDEELLELDSDELELVELSELVLVDSDVCVDCELVDVLVLEELVNASELLELEDSASDTYLRPTPVPAASASEILTAASRRIRFFPRPGCANRVLSAFPPVLPVSIVTLLAIFISASVFLNGIVISAMIYPFHRGDNSDCGKKG